MMASFNIHVDQENRVPDLRKAKDVSAPLQQKRTILGVINANGPHSRAAKPAEKKGTFKIHDDEKTFAVLQEIKATQPVAAPVVEPKVEPKVEEPALVLSSLEEEQSSPSAEPENDVSMSEVYQSPMQVDVSVDSSPRTRSKAVAERILFDMDEYRDDIYDYLLEAETKHRPKPNYMRRQPDITYTMRTILVEWMVEVAEEYRLQTETLYLAVSYIDRFLSLMSVVRAKLQLVGTAAMFIAAKYEEIYPPDVGEFVYITDDTYTKRQVLRMEHLILKVLAFDISPPTPLVFITNYCVSFDFSERVMFLAMYLCELSLLEGDPYLQFLPSVLASSTVAYARHTLGMDAWPTDVADSTGYQLSALIPCLTHLNTTHSRAPHIPQQAVREKYKHNRWHGVSLVNHRPMLFKEDVLVVD
ncbi:G2/mitotic-specific cyclin-A [Frankliniella fusca]|uniref:G2/mitotic-specific cyclin-A n=1 Tax=Frankliniella fusca TaxID=407009 RepID=A0AAE1HRI8_9NEOP|nr:G2/mitotic-specific cyclin-A [Frankliniella fusca]